MNPSGRRFLPFWVLLAGSITSFKLAAAQSAPGLTVVFSTPASQMTDFVVRSNVALYVASGQAPTPFLTESRFTATWNGDLHADLRGKFFFQAELSGSLLLEINGTNVFEVNGSGSQAVVSKEVQLNKGPNRFQANYRSPDHGDAFVRLHWAERPSGFASIPEAAFTHPANTTDLAANDRYRGRELLLEFRCLRCHVDAAPGAGVPELKMDAPSLEGIGSRRYYGWLLRWILDPRALRSQTHMPRVLRGPNSRADAEAIAAYLTSLQQESRLQFSSFQTRQAVPEDGAGSGREPRALYERLHCAGCHNPPDAAEIDPRKISQRDLGTKYPRGKLAEFLRAPEAHFDWTRMPNFRLTETEAKELEDYLLKGSNPPETAAAPTNAVILERGRELLQTSGCLNCHKLSLENRYRGPKMGGLSASTWDRGCLSSETQVESAVPAFDLSADQRAALAAFARTDRTSLNRHVSAEFAERQVRLLNCAACHGILDLIPSTALLGEKLKPEWSSRFIAGAILHKIRFDTHPKGEPWSEARMPAFPAYGSELASGLAALQGLPARTPEEPPIDAELAKIGRILVGKEGGFSCIACHGVGPLLAMEVFESEGINLAYTADRLQPAYYRRWMRNPIAVEPQTKMPSYFDEGKSQLSDILDGDAEKQISALWHYIRLRDNMPKPVTGAE